MRCDRQRWNLAASLEYLLPSEEEATHPSHNTAAQHQFHNNSPQSTSTAAHNSEIAQCRTRSSNRGRWRPQLNTGHSRPSSASTLASDTQRPPYT
ncbi:hypothetical protein C8Q76DRAFT_714988 [Earliella scabrosa]|nr:hypothetical protein C8Q76DRAFT_714988 [Earliella scabrosa]